MIAPRRRPRRSQLASFLLSFAALSLVATSAWAQPKNFKEPTPEELKGYTLPYFFTAIGVLAVTMTVCWPANRKWDIEKVEEE